MQNSFLHFRKIILQTVWWHRPLYNHSVVEAEAEDHMFKVSVGRIASPGQHTLCETLC